jgi:carbon starvation protein
MIGQFVITSLDTCARLTRFVWVEMVGNKVPLLGNRLIATIIPIAIAFYLGWTGSYTLVWPMFATTNQLVAALALLTVSVWLLEIKRPAKYTLIPGIVMYNTRCLAL